MASFDVRALVGLRRISAFDVSPDGAWLAVAASEVDPETERYRSSLWRVPTDGGAPEKLLDGPFDDAAPCFRHDGALGFLSDRHPDGGTERPEAGARKQLWLLDADGPRPLTDEPLGVSAFRFARKADRLVLVTPVLPDVPRDQQREVADRRKKKGPSALVYRDLPVRRWDHWVPVAAPHFVACDGEGRGRVDLTPDADREYREASWDLSDDGRVLVATSTHPGVHRLPATALAVFDLERGTRRLLHHAPDVGHASPCVSPDGRRVASTVSRWTEGRHGPVPLVVTHLDDGQVVELDPGTDRWLVPLEWRGEHLVCAAEVDGDRPLFLVDPEGDRTRITGAGTWDAVRGRYGLRHGTLRPPEVADLDGHTVFAASPPLAAEVHLHETRASDGARVPWRLVRPAGATGPLPTLLWIHGGPINQWGDQWHWRWNPLVMLDAGWQVVLPNPRGSTGLGLDHVEGIWGNTWGARCFEDLMEVTDQLAADPRVDAERMVAMGGSFGGYMTNWIGTRTDRFRALITHASVFSYGTFYGTTDLPAYWSFMLGSHPWGDREAFERYSPDRYVDRWKSPTLVIHGEKDYRVPISEALFLFEALRRHDVDAELLVFPDENHWILQPPNIVAWYEAVLDFLARKASP